MLKLLLSILFFGCSFSTLAQNNKPELILPSGHLELINTVIYSPDGKYILTGSVDLTIRCWETASGREINVFKGANAAITVIRFSPDGKLLLAGCSDGSIMLWDYASHTLLKTMKVHSDWVTGIDFFANDKFLSGSKDRTAKIWDLQQNTAVTTVTENRYKILSVAYYPDGDFFATGGGGVEYTDRSNPRDMPVKLWNIHGHHVKTFKHGFLGSPEDIEFLSFSADGKYLVSASLFQTRLYEVADDDGRVKKKFRLGATMGAMSPKGNMLLLGSASDADLVSFPEGLKIRTYKTLPKDMTSIAMSPDGNSFVVGTAGRLAFVYDTQSGEQLNVLSGRSGGILSVTFSPYGKYLATGSFDATTKIWDIESGTLVRVLKGQKYGISSLAFSPDNKNIAAGCLGNTGAVYDIESGQMIFAFSGGSAALAFSKDGKKLLTINKTAALFHGVMSFLEESSIFLYDVTSAQLSNRLFKPSILSNARDRTYTSGVFSPDGKFIYVGGRINYLKADNKTKEAFGFVQEWSAETGKYIRGLPGAHGEMVTSVDITADGKTLVTGSSDPSIQFWNRALGKGIDRYKMHTAQVNSVTYSPDERFLLTSGMDHNAMIMDLNSKRHHVLSGHSSALFAAKFSPNGKHIVTGSWDNTTRFWSKETGKELATLIPIDVTEWLIITPEGYFDGSEKALETLYYSSGPLVFPLRQLKSLYYKKGLLPILLGYAPGTLPSIRPFSVKDFYPEVRLNEQINERNPVLSIQLKNSGGGIGKVQVMLNGQLAVADAKVFLKDKKELAQPVFYIQIPLSRLNMLAWGNKNTIEVTAGNKADNLRCPPVSFSFNAPNKIK